MSITVMIVDDEENARYNIGVFLGSRGYEVIDVDNLSAARENIQKGAADIVLLDVDLPDGYGPDLLDETALIPNRPPIIMITAFGHIEMAVDAMINGAYDFLQKPIDLVRLEKSILRAKDTVAMRRELAHLRQTQYQGLNHMVAKSTQMLGLLDKAQRAAEASVSVLITGETGTGKEVLAVATHNMGPRAQKPYIAVNCAAIQNTMIEAELFGYEAGAFTGAEKRKHGLMEIADGGILFLDEISSMPTDMQSKLLRAVDEKAFRRVGGTSLIKVDVQIIAASNRDLRAMIRAGEFREDLYYRFKVVDLEIPPLRDRKDDISELVGLYLRHFNQKMGRNISDITPRALEALLAYEWPGNVRELKNVIERAVLFCDDPVIDLAHLPSDVVQHPVLI